MQAQPVSPILLTFSANCSDRREQSCFPFTFLGSRTIIYIFKCFDEGQIHQLNKSRKQLKCLQGRKDCYIIQATVQTKEVLSINLKATFREIKDYWNGRLQVWVQELGLSLVGSVVFRKICFFQFSQLQKESIFFGHIQWIINYSPSGYQDSLLSSRESVGPVVIMK